MNIHLFNNNVVKGGVFPDVSFSLLYLIWFWKPLIVRWNNISNELEVNDKIRKKQCIIALWVSELAEKKTNVFYLVKVDNLSLFEIKLWFMISTIVLIKKYEK
jgi:hypothetical protein